jgi:hypothetical protein
MRTTGVALATSAARLITSPTLERDHVAALIAEAVTKKLNERDRYSAKR